MASVVTNGNLRSRHLEDMTTKIVLVLLALTLLTMGAASTTAVNLQSDPSIQTFWGKFKTAVNKGDKDAVSSMSKFPIEMPYGFPKIRTKAQLIKRYRELFSVQANAVKCFADATPKVNEEDKNQFTVGCKDKAGNEVVVYGFGKTGGVWKLTSLDNLNE